MRVKINKEIGPYDDYLLALRSPEKVKPEIVNTARLLGNLAIQIQWIDGDAKKAEASFFKINQKAAPIDKTELILLEELNKPNGIAARAIFRGGKVINTGLLSAKKNRMMYKKKLKKLMMFYSNRRSKPF